MNISTKANIHTVDKGGLAITRFQLRPMATRIMAGHRYYYTDVGFNLDKVAIGDKIIVYWQSQEYDYQVSDMKPYCQPMFILSINQRYQANITPAAPVLDFCPSFPVLIAT